MQYGGLRIKGQQKTSSSLKPLLTVISTVFNGEKDIRRTIESIITQTYDNIEFILFDAASSDNTLNIIKEYDLKIDYWQSEPDKGLYYALNKAITMASGDWINLMMSGDAYFNENVLEKLFNNKTYEKDIGVLYGNSVVEREDCDFYSESGEDIQQLKIKPIYRYNASFIKADVLKKYLFDVTLFPKLGYSLDYEQIIRMLRDGIQFKRTNEYILRYKEEGMSNNNYKNIYYCGIITGHTGLGWRYNLLKTKIHSNKLIRSYYSKLKGKDKLLYTIIPRCTNIRARNRLYRKKMHVSLGLGSNIDLNVEITNPQALEIGCNTVIKSGCKIDATNKISIGSNVTISNNVVISTSDSFGKKASDKKEIMPIRIGDNVTIGASAVILQGVTIGNGAVICPCCVIDKDVLENSICHR